MKINNTLTEEELIEKEIFSLEIKEFELHTSIDYETKAGKFDIQFQPQDFQTQEKILEEVLCEVSGVILAIRDDFVRVKLGKDTIVKFPKILFQNKSFLRYGQHIKYQIKINDEGYRYQDFIKDADKVNPIIKAEIEYLLDNIKFRDEE